jgi:hypothetical protein
VQRDGQHQQDAPVPVRREALRLAVEGVDVQVGQHFVDAEQNKLPIRNPVTVGIQGGVPLSSASSTAGASREKKLAAIITPAAKPSMKSISRWLIVLKKKTREAPNAVTNQVKSVASRACQIGSRFLSQSIIIVCNPIATGFRTAMFQFFR